MFARVANELKKKAHVCRSKKACSRIERGRFEYREHGNQSLLALVLHLRFVGSSGEQAALVLRSVRRQEEGGR